MKTNIIEKVILLLGEVKMNPNAKLGPIFERLRLGVAPSEMVSRHARQCASFPTANDARKYLEDVRRYNRQHRGSNKSERQPEGNLTAIIPAESACFLINGEPCRFIGFDTYEGTTTAAMASIGSGRIFAVDIVTLHNHKPMRAEEFKTSKQ